MSPTENWLFLNCSDKGPAGRMIERFRFEQARLPWSSSPDKPKGYVDKALAQAHIFTARVLKQAMANRP